MARAVQPPRFARCVGLLWIGLLAPAEAGAEQLPIRAYTTVDGLAHNGVNKITRDSRGFLWFATNDGLSRFDGYSFSNYSVEQGLPHRRVTDLLETRSGELWVATSGGLVRFRPEGIAVARVVETNANGETTPMFSSVVPADADPRARALISLLESRDGTIWCGTRKGLFRLDRAGGRFELQPVDLGLPDEYPEQMYINDLVEDELDSLWAASPSGLYRRWKDGAVARYAGQELLGGYDHLHDLMKDRQGRIWVGSRYVGFVRLSVDAGRGAPVIAEHHGYPKLPGSWVNQLLEGADGRFWVASNLGLLEFLPPTAGGSRFLVYDRRHGLSHQEVTTMAEDADGNLWIGTWASGAMKLARGGFTTFGRQDGVAVCSVVFEDSSGQLYIHASVFAAELSERARRTASGELLTRFGRFDGRRFEWFEPGAPFEWGYVTEASVLHSRHGEWWLSGITGLMRYAPLASFADIRRTRPARVFTARDGLPDHQIYRMFEDSRGHLWVSVLTARNGLFLWSRGSDTLRDMSAVEGFPKIHEELPRAFAEDAAGNVWIGLNSGVARYRHEKFSFFTPADGLPEGAVVDIHAGSHGRLWLASSRGGLVRVDQPAAERPVFIVYTTADGLSGNSLEVIAEDLHGRIYAATGRGIDQLDPERSSVKHFSIVDGLTPGLTIAAFRDRTGALWFGTQNGLSRFMPSAPKASAAPAILVTGLKVGGGAWPVSAIGQTTLSLPDLRHDANQLEIAFASLSFAAGERLRYQYRLEGTDPEWSAPTPQRSVSYASLAPGGYRFLVRAVNADGVASLSPAVVAFTVLPPLWLRWWFLALVLLASAAVALSVHRFRVARILEIQQVRTRIATDLHDDIGANLTRIAILGEVARRQLPLGQHEVDEPLSSIASIARESATSMSDIVWAIAPERDTLQDMVRKMRDQAEDAFEGRDVALVLDLADGAPPVKLGIDFRRDLYLVFKEAVNNVARHSGCSRVAITLRTVGARLVLEVVDDGRGFDPAADNTGNGLTSMRRRAGRLGAELVVDSAAGAGTTVRLTMPLGAGAVPPAYTKG